MPRPSLPIVPVDSARHLLMSGKGLAFDPARRATAASLQKMVEHMGFVQVDTINVLERAHHHVLMSRFDDYTHDTLKRLLEKNRDK